MSLSSGSSKQMPHELVSEADLLSRSMISRCKRRLQRSVNPIAKNTVCVGAYVKYSGY